tara:strand:+ start:1902 stop:2240 length:339 start_codon:yes stop_codon:yes gene_type:complete
MSKEKKWIRAKVVVFFGLNNQFAGMYLVDTKEQVDLIMKLVYDYPYHCKVYEDIPSLNESLQFDINMVTGSIVTHITDIDGLTKSVPDKTMTGMSKEKEELFNKIEEIFGSS